MFTAIPQCIATIYFYSASFFRVLIRNIVILMLSHDFDKAAN